MFRRRIASVAVGFSILSGSLWNCLAQGSLTPPPGPPAPVMKSLEQIEARTPLIAGAPGVVYSNGTYTVTTPGSYYLTGNLTCTNATADGFIVLATNNVTLDLNGFTLFGTTGNLPAAVYATGYGYRVHNGHIVGGTTQVNGTFTLAGFVEGLHIFTGTTSRGTDTIVSDLTVRGTRDRGIFSSANSVVERCIVDTAGDNGILAGNVQNCRAINTANHAIYAGTIINSVGKCVGTGMGIAASSVESAHVENCLGIAVSDAGISAQTIINSRGVSSSSIGLYAETATNCRGESTSGVGLSAATAMNCIGSSVSGSSGMNVSGTASFCRGLRTGGVALAANIAIGCTSGGGTISASQKHLGTP